MTVEYLHSSILNSFFASINHSTAPLVLQFTNPRLHEMFRIWKFKFSYKFLIVFSKNHLTNLAFYSIIYFVAEVNISPKQSDKCDSGVVGNARPCQGRDRGFEPRLSLSEHQLKLMLFSFPSIRLSITIHYMVLPAFAAVLEKVSARKSALCKKISLSEPHLRRVWNFFTCF